MPNIATIHINIIVDNTGLNSSNDFDSFISTIKQNVATRL